jgi:hypothetical protein
VTLLLLVFGSGVELVTEAVLTTDGLDVGLSTSVIVQTLLPAVEGSVLRLQVSVRLSGFATQLPLPSVVTEAKPAFLFQVSVIVRVCAADAPWFVIVIV